MADAGNKTEFTVMTKVGVQLSHNENINLAKIEWWFFKFKSYFRIPYL